MHSEYIRNTDCETAVLMIHGIAGSPAHFKDLLPLVPPDVTVHNLLLEGHGGSVEDFAAASMKKWREQVSSQVSTLLAHHRKLLIVGHSMGSLFAIRSAVAHPDRIAGLFLLGCPLRIHLPPSTVLTSVRCALGSKGPGVEDMRADCSIELTPKLWKYLGWTPRFLELLKEIRSTRPLLARLAVPCHVFQSERDELVSLRAVRDLQKCPHAKIGFLPRSGHFACKGEDQEMLRQAFTRFLTACSFPP